MDSSLFLTDFCKNPLVRRTKPIIWNFIGRDPLDVVVFKLLRFALGNGCIEQRQMHRQIGIFVNYIQVLKRYYRKLNQHQEYVKNQLMKIDTKGNVNLERLLRDFGVSTGDGSSK